MTSFTRIGFTALAVLAGTAMTLTPQGSHAQAPAAQAPAPAGGGGGRGPAAPHGPNEFMGATIADPSGPTPDPKRISYLLPNQIKWTGNKALLYGDPTKAGEIYGLVVRLAPGQFSQPHSLTKDRWVYVVAGTLWVGNGNAASSYPVKADNFITNVAGTTFVDGNRAGSGEPTVLFISGVGSPENRIMSEYAQTTTVRATDAAGPAPNTASITITPVSTTGNQNLYGGGQGAQTVGTPYGVIQTWAPGRYSSPHYHPNWRHIYVLSGTWWTSSSTHHDTRLTYPMPAGTFVQDLPGGIHWDGNRIGDPNTTRLYITGVAPATNQGVDEDGKDRVAAGRGGYN